MITTTHVTEDDLMRLGPDVLAEVMQGELIISGSKEGITMAPVGFLHGLIAGNVYDVLKAFVREHKLGYVQGDGVLYILETDDSGGVRTALVPDVSFVRKERIPSDFDLTRPFPGAPDLAVEVISPSETAADVLAKVDAYLDAGTGQVWVLYPQRGELYLYARSAGKTVVQLHSGSDRMMVEDVLPGLEIVTETLFALPDV